MSKRAKKGVLLVQLGTPDSPSTSDVRRYLDEFLMDGRVLDIPYFNRALLVKGIIVPSRASKSAATYKTIWDENTGSPLMYYSKMQQQMLQAELGDEYHVELAMRYQNPSLPDALKKMEAMMLDSIRIIPMFPQYASATTGSVIERVMEIVRRWQYFPAISFVNSYCQDPLMIDVFVEHALRFDFSKMDHFLFSYHGLPVRQLTKTHAQSGQENHNCESENCRTELNNYCYLSQCYATTRAIVAKLNLKPEQYTVCFQSRLGKTPWIQPYTSDTLHDLAKAGKKSLLVFSPAFVADCIETLDEIQVEYANEFKELGGEEVFMVESLNTNPKWIEALKGLVLDSKN